MENCYFYVHGYGTFPTYLSVIYVPFIFPVSMEKRPDKKKKKQPRIINNTAFFLLSAEEKTKREILIKGDKY